MGSKRSLLTPMLLISVFTNKPSSPSLHPRSSLRVAPFCKQTQQLGQSRIPPVLCQTSRCSSPVFHTAQYARKVQNVFREVHSFATVLLIFSGLFVYFSTPPLYLLFICIYLSYSVMSCVRIVCQQKCVNSIFYIPQSFFIYLFLFSPCKRTTLIAELTSCSHRTSPVIFVCISRLF